MRTAARWIAVIVVFVAATFTLPSAWCRRDAGRWFEGDRARQDALAEGVGSWVDQGVEAERFSTGSERFDGEWVFGTHVMAALGIGQVALSRGVTERDLARVDRCLDVLLSAGGSDFDTRAWGRSAMADLDGEGHAAWLGYGGLAFAMRERLGPGGRHSATAERIVAAIRRRLASAPPGGPATYPGERYPVDQSSLVGTLGAWAAARREPAPPEVAAWVKGAHERFVDPVNGLLRQAVTEQAEIVDGPRGSGTFLAAYFLSFADPTFSRELFEAGTEELRGSILGFGMMREYPRGTRGWGDIDSGPVLFGYGISSTGFALGPARIHGDRGTFRSVYATARLFGAPRSHAGGMRFTTGGPLGDALLLAMLTAGSAP